jgi:hypothetical protein
MNEVNMNLKKVQPSNKRLKKTQMQQLRGFAITEAVFRCNYVGFNLVPLIGRQRFLPALRGYSIRTQGFLTPGTYGDQDLKVVPNNNSALIGRTLVSRDATFFTKPEKRLRKVDVGVNKRDSSYYTDKDKVLSITYEEIGLFPRSFSRVLDRFLKQLFSDVDNLVIQEYRFYRYLFLTTIKTIFILLAVPLVVNFMAKNYVVKPVTEYFWNTQHPEIFLNSYEQKRAFAELEKFEEKIYFETLVQYNNYASLSGEYTSENQIEGRDENPPFNTIVPPGYEPGLINGRLNTYTVKPETLPVPPYTSAINGHEGIKSSPQGLESSNIKLSLAVGESEQSLSSSARSSPDGTAVLIMPGAASNTGLTGRDPGRVRVQLSKDVFKLYGEKTIELATYYNNHSIEAITNFFADLLSFCSLLYLLVTLEIQINITKSFLAEVFFGLDDSKKSLLILLVTDLLVGYHSSNLWELFFGFIFNHYGIPESQTGIFLLVATLPVLLDVLFKYLIFRHLNRSSPATVATYQAIIE